MTQMNNISINIWDDYYEDDNIPANEIQETYIYVEDYDIPVNDTKKYLEFLLEHINENIDLEGVELRIEFYDSKLKYPNLIGTEHAWCLFERWELRAKHLTHEKRYQLLDDLKSANLMIDNLPLHIYSES